MKRLNTLFHPKNLAILALSLGFMGSSGAVYLTNQELASTQQSLQTVQEEAKILETTIQQQETSLTQLKTAKETAEKTAKELTQKQADTEKKSKELEAQKAEAEKKYKELETKKAEADKKIKELESKSAEADKKAKEFESKLAELDKAFQTYKTENDTYIQLGKAREQELATAQQAEAPQPVEQAAPQIASFVAAAPAAYYPNCSAARAAGAAPVYQGSPGYGSHLDRDGDGVGCE